MSWVRGSAAAAWPTFSVAATCGYAADADRRRVLRALTARVNGSGEPASALQRAEADELRQSSRAHRTLGIVTGIAGGVAVITGAVLVGLARTRANARAGVVPALAPGWVGLDLRLKF